MTEQVCELNCIARLPFLSLFLVKERAGTTAQGNYTELPCKTRERGFCH